ncbi:MAG: PocR ligand-binding domain-containing protein [Nitrospirae bacterium]|uniref:PocR ligand-binding domain-containing protein n=1 Tax=Candidatus Magnetobacterium casense TaxID=1455061 RepID=UPI0005906F86|nr:PocR ligand-binding domain-containing protein [Candidatus Magnetobacterium casensis]MBF0337527.1 PocR ligand-binding domain-containing protein [Nitrospirota bacterium]
MKTLKTKLILIVVAVYLMVGAATYAALKFAVDSVVMDLGVNYAAMLAEVQKNRLLPVLQRELALALKMADSSLLKLWARNENDPNIRKLAMQELQSYRNLFHDKSYFIAPVATQNFYFNNAANEFEGRELRQHLSQDKEDDKWFFSTLKDIDGFDLNVDSNEALGVTKVWFNIVMRDGNERLAVCGTGIDLSEFIKKLVISRQSGISTVLIGQNGDIKAHPDVRFIDFNAVTKSETSQKTIYGLLNLPGERSLLRAALDTVRAGKQDVETLSVTLHGHKHIASVTYMPDLDWYAIVLVDTSRLIDLGKFLPLTVITILSMLTTVIILVSLLHKVILNPLSRLTESTRKMAAGTYDISLPVTRTDEIGTLTESFNTMAATVLDYTSNLDNKVKEQTEQLRQLIEMAPDAMVVVDCKGTIISFNEQAQMLFEYIPEEVIGQPIEILIPHRYRDKHVGYRDAFIANPRIIGMGSGLELIGLAYGGREIPMDASLSYTDTGGSRQIICALRDITERKRVDALKVEKEVAEEAAARAQQAQLEAEGARQELQAKVQEVERFNRLALGREERIVELKRQVNSLIVQVGGTAPYIEYGLEATSSDELETPLEESVDSSVVKPNLEAILDLKPLQDIFQTFCELVGIPAAIIDLEAKVLASSNWQRACTDFHRVNEQTCKRCIESDTQLALNLQEGKDYAIYSCKNGLTDCASPIFVDDHHVANVFIGQFFIAPPDLEFFAEQARQFNFDKDAYLDAIRDVPIMSEDRLPAILTFLAGFARIVTSISYQRMKAQSAERFMARRTEELKQQHTSAMSLAEDANQARAELERYKDQLELLVQQRTEQLQKSEELSRMLLISVAEGIFGVDADGVVVFINPAALRMLLYAEGELIGQNIHAMIHHACADGSPHDEEFCPMYKTNRYGIASQVDDDILWRKNGSYFRVEYSATPIYKDRAVVGSVVTFRDITERKKVEEQLKQHVMDLERFNRLTIGREEKMIHLKQEINELSEELGRVGRYKIVH